MELTKKKLEQLIMEEYVRAIGDEGKPTNYPQYSDKLTTLAKSDPIQARSLADSLDDPLDMEFDPSNMEAFEIDGPFQMHLNSPEYQLHYDFLIDDRGSSFMEEPDIGEMYEFAIDKGLDPEDTRRKIMKSYGVLVQHSYVKHNKFDPAEEVRKIHGGSIYESKKGIKK